MDSGQIDDGLFRSGMGQLMGLVMILPILIAEFKLGVSFCYKRFFPLIKLRHLSCPVRTMIIAALVEGDLFPLFPGKQGMVTVRAVVLGLFPLLESLTYLKKGVTDLASKLSPFDPVVVVEIGMGSTATGTDNLFMHTGRGGAIFHGR